MASAAFTINGGASPQSVAAGALVTLALTSTTGVRTVEWTILGGSDSSKTPPTITPAGSPSGATATFTMNTPVGAVGLTWLVRCRVNGGTDDEGKAVSAHVATGVVGVLNSAAVLPFAVGEKFERHATHGIADDLNELLVNIGASSNATSWRGQNLDSATFTTPPTFSHPEYDGTKWVAQTQLNIASGSIVEFKGSDGIRYPSGGQLNIYEGATSVLIVRDNELRIGDLHGAGTDYTIGYATIPTTENGRGLVIQAQSVNGAAFVGGTTSIRGGRNLDAGGVEGDVEIRQGGVVRVEIEDADTEFFTPTGLDALSITETAIGIHLATVNFGNGADVSSSAIIGTAGATVGMTLLWKGGTGPTGGNAYCVGGDGSSTDGNAGIITADLASGVIVLGSGAIQANHASGQYAELQVAGNPYVRFQETGSGAIAASGTQRVRHTFLLVRRNLAGTADQNIINFGASDLLVIGEATDGGSILSRTPSGFSHQWDIGGISAMVLSSTLLDVDVAAVSIGTSPAPSGSGLRLTNNTNIWFNNGAGGTALNGLTLDASDNLIVGANTGVASIISRAATGGNMTWSFGGTLAMTVVATGLDVDGSFISVGTNPAAAGNGLRLANAAAESYRNQANSADITAVTVTSGNVLQLGEDTDLSGGMHLRVPTGTSITALVNAVEKFKLDGSNLQLLSTTVGVGGGTGVISIPNASTAPTTNPSNGIILYAEAGLLRYRDAFGTVHDL